MLTLSDLSFIVKQQPLDEVEQQTSIDQPNEASLLAMSREFNQAQVKLTTSPTATAYDKKEAWEDSFDDDSDKNDGAVTSSVVDNDTIVKPFEDSAT